MNIRFAAFALAFMTFLLFPDELRAGDYPKITFEYGDLYDRFCADVMKKTVEPAAVEELETRFGEFQAEWQKEAPQLFRATVKLTKAPFEFSEVKAALSSCNPGSLSFPLIINVRPYLKSINGENALPLGDFVFTVFHENLHRYVNDRKKTLPGATTRLLTKYKVEPQPVRNHIHLFAVLDEAYRKLERQKDLDRHMAFENRLSFAAHYKRAREIIAAEETENVICEISKNGCRRTAKR